MIKYKGLPNEGNPFLFVTSSDLTGFRNLSGLLESIFIDQIKTKDNSVQIGTIKTNGISDRLF